MGVMAKKCWYFSNVLHWNTSETPLRIASTESRLLKVFLPLLNGFNNSRRKVAVYQEILANLPTLFGIYSRDDRSVVVIPSKARNLSRHGDLEFTQTDPLPVIDSKVKQGDKETIMIRFSPNPNRAHLIRWYEWGGEAFRQAEAQNKPVILFLSAFWCRICQRMDEGAFSDDDNIALLNAFFIALRVENAQRSDVDARYNLNGWPTI